MRFHNFLQAARVLGLSLGYPWAILGVSLGYPWAILGLSLGYTWAILGLSLGYPWAILGVERRKSGKIKWRNECRGLRNLRCHWATRGRVTFRQLSGKTFEVSQHSNRSSERKKSSLPTQQLSLKLINHTLNYRKINNFTWTTLAANIYRKTEKYEHNIPMRPGGHSFWLPVSIHNYNYQNKNFALRLALIERLRGTRKWFIVLINFNWLLHE